MLLRFVASFLLWSGIWIGGCTLAFLLLPLLSECPLWAGVCCGLVLVAGQLLWGQRALVWLLALSKAVPVLDKGKYGESACLDVPFPFVFALGAQPQLVITTALSRLSDDSSQALAACEWTRSHLGGYLGRYLTAALALPCLLGAFEALTSDYGSVRFSQGPLWFLGRFCGIVACGLTLPLRWASPQTELYITGSDSHQQLPAFVESLEKQLSGFARLPAWVFFLDLLSPVCIARARKRAQYALLDVGHLPPVPVETDGWVVAFPWLGLAVGIVLALAPAGLWGAPLCCWGLGWATAVFYRLWPGRKHESSLAQACALSMEVGRGIPVVLQGRLIPRPQDAWAQQGVWLATAKGRVRLTDCWGLKALPEPQAEPKEELAAHQTSKVQVSGWFLPESLHVVVGIVEKEGHRIRSYPLYRRLMLPLWVAFLGLLWCMLQLAGL